MAMPTAASEEARLVLRGSSTAWSPALESTQRSPAREAYDEAVDFFNKSLTEDERKRIWLGGKTSMEQIQEAVLAAKTKYEVRSEKAKIWKWVVKLSERLVSYGKIIDTMAQYDPGHMAIACGAMKFLLMAVLNHEEYLSQLCKALSKIAVVLPRIDLKVLLYPTDQMKHAVSMLYACIIKFMHRAMEWYLDGRVRHFIASVFRPAHLRLDDLLDQITTCSQHVDELAIGAAQAEQRDMHSLLLELKRTIAENQVVNSRIFLDSQRRTCEIQFSQILTFTATSSLQLPEESFRRSEFLSNRRRLRITSEPQPSWKSPKLKEWAASKESSLILVRGTCLTRLETQDFATDIVGLLRAMKRPVVWTLCTKSVTFKNEKVPQSPIDVLKQLVLQVLQLNMSLLSEQSTSLNAARFQTATTETEWFGLLGEVLGGLRQVFIVVDTDMLAAELSSQISWPSAFLNLLNNMKTVSGKTIVKVVLVSSNNSPYLTTPSRDMLDQRSIRIDKKQIAAKKNRRSHATTRVSGAEMLKPFLLKFNTLLK